jgi:DNA-directed RNA polymerase specialized sigma subunit
METIEKILNILKMKNKPKSYSVKFYAEMVLEDGRVLATEDDQFMIGSKVFAINDDGEASTIELSEEVVEESKEEELAEESEAEETDWAKTFEEMKDRVAALEEKVFGKKAEEETEELSKEDNTEEKTEMSSELIGELTTQIEELKSKIVELSGQPAEEGIQHSPEGVAKTNLSIDIAKMSARERASYYINSNK